MKLLCTIPQGQIRVIAHLFKRVECSALSEPLHKLRTFGDCDMSVQVSQLEQRYHLMWDVDDGEVLPLGGGRAYKRLYFPLNFAVSPKPLFKNKVK